MEYKAKALPRSNSRLTIQRTGRIQNANQVRLNFCLDIIEKTSLFAIAVKVNEQYVKGFTENEHKKITEECKKNNLISIYDCKLNDISDTAESALYWINRWGYDAITVNVMPGNLKELTKIAHDFNPPLGIIPLLIMSNPESKKYFIDAKIGDSPVYLEIAKEVKEYNADGCVIGASKFIEKCQNLRNDSTCAVYNTASGVNPKSNIIKNVIEIIGKEKIILVPGIGVQGGGVEKFRIKRQKTKGKRQLVSHDKLPLIINVGRDIIYSESPEQKAKEYKEYLGNLFSF